MIHEAMQDSKCLRVLIILIYSAALLIVGSSLLTQYGFPLDDSYIHQTVARNFAQYGIPSFIPGVQSSGSTSVLWACIQASDYKIFHLDPILFNLAISWALLASIGLLLFTLAERDGLPLPLAFALATCPALSGNFIWLALIGMEHLLFVAVSLAGIYFWLDADPERLRSAILAGLCTGLLVLIRPEAMIFGPLLALTARKLKRSLSDTLSALAVWSIFMAVLLATNFYTSHSLMPATLAGKTWLYFHGTGGPHSLQSIGDFLLGWLVRPSMQFSIFTSGPYWELLLRVTLSATIVLIGAFWLYSQRGARINLLLLFAAAHSCVYLLGFPAQGQGGRYQTLNLLLSLPCMFFGLLFLLRLAAKRHPQVAGMVAVLALVFAGAVSLRTWRTVTIDGIAHINDTHGRVAKWLIQNIPPGTSVASFDIGKISYASDRPLIDLGGLVDPAYVPYLENGSVPSYISERHATVVILPSGTIPADLGFSQTSSTSLAKVVEYCSPADIWRIGFVYTGHAEQCQQVYRAVRF